MSGQEVEDGQLNQASSDIEVEVAPSDISSPSSHASSSSESEAEDRRPTGVGAESTATSRQRRSMMEAILSLFRNAGGGNGDEDSDDPDFSPDGSADEEEMDLGAYLQRRFGTSSKKRSRVPAKPKPEDLKTLRQSDYYLSTLRTLGLEEKVELIEPESNSSPTSDRPPSKSRRSSSSTSSQVNKTDQAAATSSSTSDENVITSGQQQQPEEKVSVVQPVKNLAFLLRDRQYFKSPISRENLRLNIAVSDNFLPSDSSVLVKRFSQKVFCGQFSKCGDKFITAAQDHIIRVFDSKVVKDSNSCEPYLTDRSFNLLQEIQAQNVGWSVLDVALSPDNRHLIYSSWCDSIHQVQVTPGTGSSTDESLEKHEALDLAPSEHRHFCVFSLRFSPEGEEILCGCNEGYLYLYDRVAHKSSLSISGHETGYDVNAVAFVDETTHILASGSDDGLVKIWDRRSLRESKPKPVGTFAGHIEGITYIDPKMDGRHIISNSKDQSIKLWDLRRFSNQTQIDKARRQAEACGWDYRWQGVPSFLQRENMGRFDTTSIMTYRSHTVKQTLIRCRFSPSFPTGQRYIYTGCSSGRVFIYDSLSGEVVKTLSGGHRDCVRDVSWHPFTQDIVSASWDGSLKLWSYNEGESAKMDEEIEESNCENSSSKKRKKNPGCFS